MVKRFVIAVMRLNLWWLALFGLVSVLAGVGIAVFLGAMIRWPSSASAICLGSLFFAIAICWPAIKEHVRRQ